MKTSTGNDNPTGITGSYNGEVATGGMYDPYTRNMKRIVTDMTVPGCLGAYPLKVTRYYNSRSLSGGDWTVGDFWAENNSDVVTAPDGRKLDFGNSVRGLEEYEDSQGVHLTDGGLVVFANYTINGLSYKRQTKLIDPYGLVTTITYQTNNSTDVGGWVKVTEPGGRYLLYQTIKNTGGYVTDRYVEAHDLSGALLEKVHYNYDSWSNPNNPVTGLWVLSQVDYDDGTHAYYTYSDITGGQGKFPWLISCDDVRFGGSMRRIKYTYDTPEKDTSGNTTVAGALYQERSFSGPLVSQIEVPGNDSNRRETRGDGLTRSFNFGGSSGRLYDYGDFAGYPHTILTYSLGYVQTMTNPRGYKTTYTRADSLRPQAITRLTHPDATHVDFVYEPWPLQSSKTDERGKTTAFDRDLLHRIYQTRYPDGALEYFWYNANNQVLKHQLRNGAFEYFEYNARGLLSRQWSPTATKVAATPDAIAGLASPYTSFTYYQPNDPVGGNAWLDRLKVKTLPANANGYAVSESYEYDRTASTNAPCRGRGLVTKITHGSADDPSVPHGDGTSRAFGYDIYGNKVWEQDEQGHRTSYTYDEYKRVTRVTDPLNHATTYSYENTTGSSTSPLVHTTNSPRFMTDPAGVVTANAYDANYHKVSATLGYGSGAGVTTWFDYDAVGNLTTVTDPRGTGLNDANYTTATDYDSRDRKWHVTDPLGQTTTFTYDGTSNVTNVLRPDGNNEVKTYDELGRVLTDTVAEDPQKRITIRDYNPAGTLNSVDVTSTITGSAHQITTFLYDASDRKIQMNYPSPSTDKQFWDYDDAGNPQTRTTVDGEVQSFGYDARNFNNQVVWNNGAEWRYFGHDPVGRINEAWNGTGTWNTNYISRVSRSYDAAGHLTHDKQNVTGGGIEDVTYTYDPNNGRLIDVAVGTGASQSYDRTYTYDVLGRVDSLGDVWRGSRTIDYSYDKASNITGRNAAFNGASNAIVYGRDALNRITYRQASVNGAVISKETYSYDVLSRLSQTARTDDGRSDTFGYDLLSQLTSANYGLVNSANPTRTVGYSLDNSGNRKQVNDTGVFTTYAQAGNTDALNQYSAVGGAAVNNDGHDHAITAYAGISYDYLNDEHLSNVTGNGATYQLQYDAFGRTVSRTLNGATTYFYFQGENAFQETGAVLVTNHFGLGTDEIVCRLPSTGQTYLYFPDHEGSITHVTNLGAMAEKYRYDVFGQPKIMDAAGNARTLSAIGNRFLFTGREWAPANFGFYEYRARAYHPGLGRFMSEDPKGFDAGDYNLFRYCANDPVDRVDPMGLETLKSTDYSNLQLKGATPDQWQNSGIQEFLLAQNTVRGETALRNAQQVDAKFNGEVHWRETGNWKDTNLAAHLSSDKKYDQNGQRLAGWTDKPTFSSYPERDVNGLATGAVVGELHVNVWVSRNMPAQDQRAVFEKEMDHARAWAEFESFRKTESFFELRSLIGRGTSESAAGQLQSYMNGRIQAEFQRQQTLYDFSGQHNYSVQFLGGN